MNPEEMKRTSRLVDLHRGLRLCAEVAENWCGILMGGASLLALPVGALGYMSLGGAVPSPWRELIVLVSIPTIFTGLGFIYYGLGHASDGHFPVAIALALQHPRIAFPLRLPVSLWWAFESSWCLFVAAGMHLTAKKPSDVFVAWIVAVLTLYVADSFLLLSLATWRKDPRWLGRIWRVRHPFNFVAASLLALLF